MTLSEVQQLPADEARHFTLCMTCGSWFDMRDLDSVFFHCTDHVPRPDIPYAGRGELKEEAP